MRAICWLVAPLMLVVPALSQTDPAEVNRAAEVTESGNAATLRSNTTRGSKQPESSGSPRRARGYRRPQRFLRDLAPPLTKPVPLRLGTFSRKWARSGRETLAERRRLLWQRVEDARNDLPRRREVFQPASGRDEN